MLNVGALFFKKFLQSSQGEFRSPDTRVTKENTVTIITAVQLRFLLENGCFLAGLSMPCTAL